ncbi:hypothetical protein NMY22_g10049 [Coprinellus aureogranulatus]|nr:hypothetical protein NMY22_g10049 [Coprinellus aureogranulatus]
MRYNLGTADLAFLSACQTGTGSAIVSEEAVHLAAGMLSAGYRGVVATMWSIQDTHAPQVAEDFYGYLLRTRGNEAGSTVSVALSGTNAAHALHKATRNLREQLGTSDLAFLAWVPYVHFERGVLYNSVTIPSADVFVRAFNSELMLSAQGLGIAIIPDTVGRVEEEPGELATLTAHTGQPSMNCSSALRAWRVFHLDPFCLRLFVSPPFFPYGVASPLDYDSSSVSLFVLPRISWLRFSVHVVCESVYARSLALSGRLMTIDERLQDSFALHFRRPPFTARSNEFPACSPTHFRRFNGLRAQDGEGDIPEPIAPLKAVLMRNSPLPTRVCSGIGGCVHMQFNGICLTRTFPLAGAFALVFKRSASTQGAQHARSSLRDLASARSHSERGLVPRHPDGLENGSSDLDVYDHGLA